MTGHNRSGFEGFTNSPEVDMANMNTFLQEVQRLLASHGIGPDNAFLNSESDPFDGVLEAYADAVIAEARYPNPYDRVLDSLDEAGPGALPGDEELARAGVDRLWLAGELQGGLNPRLFTRALRAGYLPAAGASDGESGYSLNERLEMFLAHRRDSRRLRDPRNRALRTHGVCI